MDIAIIKSFIEEQIQDSDMFLVDIALKPNNFIQVYVDKPVGITIDECVEISRKFNETFNRDYEDYELQVSSPGLDMPLKVAQQFEKHKGREVNIIMNDGSKFKAVLLDYNDDELKLQVTKKVKEEGRKRKKLVTEEKIVKRIDIKAVKAVISFK